MELGSMDYGGEAARPTTAAASTEMGMPGAVRRSAANIGSSGAAVAPPGGFSHFDFSAAAGRGVIVPVATEFPIHHEPGHGGVAYPTDIGAPSWRQLCPVHVGLVGPQLPGEYGSSLPPFVPVRGNYGYYSALQTRPGAGHGEVLVDQLPDGTGHGEAFVGLLPGSVVDAAYDNYGYYDLQSRPGAGHREVLVGLLPDGAGHGEEFVGLVPGGGGVVHNDYGYYAWQPRLGAGRGEVLLGPLPEGVDAVFDNSGNFGSADEIGGALRDPNLGAGHDGSGALADNLGAGYNNHGMVNDHLRRLLPFVGIGASSVAINGLAASPGSPAAAFELLVLLLGGLFLVMLSVLRV